MANNHKRQGYLSVKAPVALFDLDGTLIEGDSETMWSRFLLKKGAVGEGFLTRILDYYQDYENGHLDIYEYEAFLLFPLTIHPPKVLLEWRAEYLLQVRQALRTMLIRKINLHRRLGFTLLLITASNSFIAEPIAEMLRIPHLICTQVKVENGRLTTQLEGIPAFREGKVQRLEEWCSRYGLTLQGSWGYSDSHNDLPLLHRVENPVAVFPDQVLLAYARERRWEVIGAGVHF